MEQVKHPLLGEPFREVYVSRHFLCTNQTNHVVQVNTKTDSTRTNYVIQVNTKTDREVTF